MAKRRNKTGILFVAVALGSASLAADGDGAWRKYESRAAGLRFEIPPGTQVFERTIHTHVSMPSTVRVHSLRIVAEGLSEERSLCGPVYVRIEVQEVAGGQDASEWLARASPSSARVEKLAARVVAGVPATVVRLRQENGMFLLQASLARDRRIFRILSGPRADDQSAFKRVLESLTINDVGVERRAALPAASVQAIAVAPTVRMVILVPSDRALQTDYVVGVERAIRQLQVFYRRQIASGKTFLLHDPVVEWVYTGHPSSWYSSQHPADGGFWENALADGFAALGGGYDDPNNRWIFYIDADQLCNQYVGGIQGVAVMPANDLRGLVCQSNVPPCTGRAPDNLGVCRWVGGAGHEIGHSFNLDDLKEGQCPTPDTACENALMGLGYTSFPNAYLLPSNVSSLVTASATAQFFMQYDPGTAANPCSGAVVPLAPRNTLKISLELERVGRSDELPRQGDW